MSSTCAFAPFSLPKDFALPLSLATAECFFLCFCTASHLLTNLPSRSAAATCALLIQHSKAHTRRGAVSTASSPPLSPKKGRVRILRARARLIFVVFCSTRVFSFARCDAGKSFGPVSVSLTDSKKTQNNVFAHTLGVCARTRRLARSARRPARPPFQLLSFFLRTPPPPPPSRTVFLGLLFALAQIRGRRRIIAHRSRVRVCLREF